MISVLLPLLAGISRTRILGGIISPAVKPYRSMVTATRGFPRITHFRPRPHAAIKEREPGAVVIFLERHESMRPYICFDSGDKGIFHGRVVGCYILNRTDFEVGRGAISEYDLFITVTKFEMEWTVTRVPSKYCGRGWI